MGISTILALLLAQDAKAQDGLTPTDVLPMGRFTVTARLSTSIGQGTLELGPTFDEDAELREFVATIEAAVGLGGGFEVEASLPIAILNEFEVDQDNVEFSQEAKGIGDLTLGVNFAVVPETKDGPQIMLGAFIVLPTGSDDAGEAEIVINNVVVQDGDEAGFGTGAFQFGFQGGISKRFSQLEPYLAIRYLIGGKGDDGDVETEFADVLTILVGTEIHGGDQLTIDIRGIIQMKSDEVEEDEFGAESTEEAHMIYGIQGRVYASLGSQVALVLGLGAVTVEDHAISEESNFDLTGTFAVTAEIGLHISFGR